MDPIEQIKQGQRAAWATFAPIEWFTTPPAARLVALAGVRAGQRVLDVACGTGVVALTAAGVGAEVVGLDLTPELIAHARENQAIARRPEVAFEVGDVEALPYGDASFDVVVSQFGHMFAPRPEVAVGEMLRVLRPGGTIAFSTWPPHLFVGRVFAYVAGHLPPPPIATPPPWLWGDPTIVRERLGDRVEGLRFDGGTMSFPALSPGHYQAYVGRSGGPVAIVTQRLAGDPAALERFQRGYEGLVAEYLADNQVRQDYLVTVARKR